MKEPLVSKMLRISLYGVFIFGVLCTITLPFKLKSYIDYFKDSYQQIPGYRTFIFIFLFVIAIPALWSVLEMIGMLCSISQGPFVMRNVHALNRVGILLLVLAALFFAKCFVYVTFLTLVCGLLMLICGLFAFTLANLFRQAVIFKEENDLTI